MHGKTNLTVRTTVPEPRVDGNSVVARTRRAGGTGRIAQRTQGVEWWMWPHLWSLDAPLVAVTWQRWWAHAAGIALPWRYGIILGAAVWTMYLADRLADVSPENRPEHGTARHRFYGERRSITASLVAGLLLALAGMTPIWLSRQEFRAGLGVLALAAAYFWLTHRRSAWAWTTFLPKEAAVGGLFTVGTAVFIWGRAGHGSLALWLGWLLCAALCSLNCALISRWESTQQDRLDPASLQNAFPGVARRLGDDCLTLAALALGAGWALRAPVYLPIAVGAALLWWLDRRRTGIGVDALRVLADVALLTPWCFWWI